MLIRNTQKCACYDVFIDSLAQPVGELWPKLAQKPNILGSRAAQGVNPFKGSQTHLRGLEFAQ